MTCLISVISAFNYIFIWIAEGNITEQHSHYVLGEVREHKIYC